MFLFVYYFAPNAPCAPVHMHEQPGDGTGTETQNANDHNFTRVGTTGYRYSQLIHLAFVYGTMHFNAATTCSSTQLTPSTRNSTISWLPTARVLCSYIFNQIPHKYPSLPV